jgi:hypothetical protein
MPLEGRDPAVNRHVRRKTTALQRRPLNELPIGLAFSKKGLVTGFQHSKPIGWRNVSGILSMSHPTARISSFAKTSASSDSNHDKNIPWNQRSVWVLNPDSRSANSDLLSPGRARGKRDGRHGIEITKRWWPWARELGVRAGLRLVNIRYTVDFRILPKIREPFAQDVDARF